MNDSTPYITSVNLVVRDMAAALAFYRLLGLPIAAGMEQRPHVSTPFPGGLSLEFDTRELTRAYDLGWQERAAGNGVILQFMLPSRGAVDAKFAELTGAAHRGQLAPIDAFWGARYAAPTRRPMPSTLKGTELRCTPYGARPVTDGDWIR